MLGRRILVLMAVLLGLTALVTSLAPRPTVGPREGRVATPAPTASPTPAAPSAPSGGTVVARTIDATPGARAARVRVRVGDTVRLAVRGDVLDAVEIKGLDEIEPVEPGSPARFEFLAERAGEHPLLLQDADRRIGLLDIRA